MTRQQHDLTGRTPDVPGSVWIRVGTLDAASVRQARMAMSQPSIRSATSVLVDLSGLDDRHELTGFALVVELKHRVTMNGGSVTAVNPPNRLAANLVACDVPIAQEPLPRPQGALVVDFGTPLG